jgi:hypothetical protein
VVCVCVTFFTFSWVESSRHQWCLDAVIEDVYQKGKRDFSEPRDFCRLSY